MNEIKNPFKGEGKKPVREVKNPLEGVVKKEYRKKLYPKI
jgi:hypothetical protein